MEEDVEMRFSQNLVYIPFKQLEKTESKYITPIANERLKRKIYFCFLNQTLENGGAERALFSILMGRQ